MDDDSITIPHRGRELLDVLARLGGSARNTQIAQIMDVSEETVRRLVKALARANKVERVHGGTYLSRAQDTPMFSGALEHNADEKTDIAKRVCGLLEDEMVLFITVGSTMTHVAEQLRELRGLTVVSNSLSVVASLADHNGTRAILAGGEVIRSERGSFGRAAEELACQYSYDAVICGADALSLVGGVLASNPLEADLIRALRRNTYRMIVAADHTKFGAKAANVSCPFDKVTDLVTDGALPDAFVPVLKEAGVKAHIVSQCETAGSKMAAETGRERAAPRKRKKNRETTDSKAGKSGSRKRKTQ
ncbi:transcriptional regulator, DeoR family [Ruegeria halocynthiae]|uniref:Transcriptional regulator, DeoR family n=1 Tax=Ruegeria halocynthiae TaxID=985054 RepID=A0A1H3BGB6_9RHOB|nr:DeoR/GlpR family DNA-binding transcription regulator [Ruegeria halocynthiae]SDX40741.1 transcriptional regulator, DeoR family [Ruegeria halocynthiae]